MSIKFEVVKEYKDKNINLPERSTESSAGYDIESAVDIVVPSLYRLIKDNCNNDYSVTIENEKFHSGYSLEDVKKLVKRLGLRTMVPTGLKVKMENCMCLQLHPRSSTGSNCLLQLANQTGIIDADYYNNEDNEGHIFVALINLSPVDIKIKKGDKIAQGIFVPFYITDDDEAKGIRTGGFGSTDNVVIDNTFITLEDAKNIMPFTGVLEDSTEFDYEGKRIIKYIDK